MMQHGVNHGSKTRFRRALVHMILWGTCLWLCGSAALADNLPPPPMVGSAGSRYLAITPQPWDNDVALAVVGFPCVPWWGPQPCPGVECPIVDCVWLYVQADGVLGPIPYYQSVDDWGTVYARGAEIVPDALYTAKAVDPQYGAGAAMHIAKTFKWGDTNRDCAVNSIDILCFVNAFEGSYTAACTRQRADQIATLDRCGPPDGVINISDLVAIYDAFGGMPFPCEDPCP